MDRTTLLELLKLKLGISTILRDEPLKKILDSVITELEQIFGVKLDKERADHEMFLVDFAAYRYEGGADMPRHLQFRLHNLQISSKKEGAHVESRNHPNHEGNNGSGRAETEPGGGDRDQTTLSAEVGDQVGVLPGQPSGAAAQPSGGNTEL